MSDLITHSFDACMYPAGCTGCIPDGGLTFTQWLQLVDRALEARCGLSHLDLGDWAYRDAFDSEVSPEEAAVEVPEQEGFPFT